MAAGRYDSTYNPVWYQETKMRRNVNAKLDENFISIYFTSLPGNSSPFCDIHLTYKEEHQLQLQLICLLSLRHLTYLPLPPPHPLRDDNVTDIVHLSLNKELGAMFRKASSL